MVTCVMIKNLEIPLMKDNAKRGKILTSYDSESDCRLLRQLLHPSRLDILKIVTQYREISVPDLMELTGLQNNAIQQSLSLLETLSLVKVKKQVNAGHGQKRVATSLMAADVDALKIRIELKEHND